MVRKASIRVTGVVQGVYYRYYTKEVADELGLTGTVKNMPDGSVSIVCEGREEDVRRLIEWCRHGPPPVAWTWIWRTRLKSKSPSS